MIRRNRGKKTGYGRRQAALLRRRRILALRWAITVTAVVLLLSLLLALGFSGRVNAEEGEALTYYKYYRACSVADGDTLWSYAETYRCIGEAQSRQDYIAEVMSINHLRDDHIREGQILILPYYETTYYDGEK